MRLNHLLPAASLAVLSALACWTPLKLTVAFAQSEIAGQKVVAVSGAVTGTVQGVGFRAMIQKQAIQYNLAGSAKNNTDKSVQFVLQGPQDRIDQALKVIRKGPKKSSNVKVDLSTAEVKANLETFTVFGWTLLSRHISHPYDLVFNRRHDDTTISKHEAKAVWLEICEKTVEGEDMGKCDKDDIQ